MKAFRYWMVVVLLVATVLVLARRSKSEWSPPREPLSRIPVNILGWHGTDQTIDADTLEVLGAGEFLSRVYVQEGKTPPTSLFIGYFPSQRTGVSAHSPKHCLPGAGWTFESSKYVGLLDKDGITHRVGEYVIGNGADKAYVIYWYEAHGRSMASEYSAMYHMIADGIRMNRSDGALVRVITSIAPDEDLVKAKTRAESFVAHLAPMLPRFIPK